jgi:phi LC3 family holin
MMINWKVRIKNRYFWLSLIPAVILLVQAVFRVFGLVIDLGELGNNLAEVVNAVFAVLAILGVVNDPTTAGISDSELAMTYEAPKEGGNNG